MTSEVDALIERLRGMPLYVFSQEDLEASDVCDRAADLIAAQREALERIEQGDIPRPVASYWRSDRKPSKHDQCEHGLSMWQDCGECVSSFAARALGRGG